MNITPVMNIFLILVPFLLLTAVFVKIAILEFSLPSTETRAAGEQPAKAVVTVLAITESGFEVKTEGAKFPRIDRQDGAYDFKALVETLRKVKAKHSESEDIIIAPQASVKYQTIISVMDRCRENGFPNISISG